MLTRNLFDLVLVQPAREGCDRLRIVSGYASAAMASRHLEALSKDPGLANVGIELIVGMTPSAGIDVSNHKGFQDLSRRFVGRFACSYLMENPPVHAKVYTWCKGVQPVRAFVGSANYTQAAFTSQREAMDECDPKLALEYYESLIPETIFCTHHEVENIVRVHMEYEQQPPRGEEEAGSAQPGGESVTLSLLAGNGRIHARGGLNWGQRPGREPNQAYIPIPMDIARSGFFPPVGVHFTVLTDDGSLLICTRAQQGGKAIETPLNNSDLGRYFRRRLGVAPGAFVTEQDLKRYGRTDVTFYKLDDETYYMDFSVPRRV